MADILIANKHIRESSTDEKPSTPKRERENLDEVHDLKESSNKDETQTSEEDEEEMSAEEKKRWLEVPSPALVHETI